MVQWRISISSVTVRRGFTLAFHADCAAAGPDIELVQAHRLAFLQPYRVLAAVPQVQPFESDVVAVLELEDGALVPRQGEGDLGGVLEVLAVGPAGDRVGRGGHPNVHQVAAGVEPDAALVWLLKAGQARRLGR